MVYRRLPFGFCLLTLPCLIDTLVETLLIIKGNGRLSCRQDTVVQGVSCVQKAYRTIEGFTEGDAGTSEAIPLALAL